MEIYDKVLDVVENLNPKRVLIHSDIMKGFPIKLTDRNKFLSSHAELLISLYNNAALWVPVFNYNFCKGDVFSIQETPSQLGVLSEYFRKNISNWRTPTPVFSFSGVGQKPECELKPDLDPFDDNSAFHLFNNHDSLIMHYGSELKHTTIIHYIERISGKLVYRYDKSFSGTIIDEKGLKYTINLKYHVRPMGYHLDYDWVKLYDDLKGNGIVFNFNEGNTNILLIKSKELIDFWVEKLTEDSLYLLDDESKKWIVPKLNKLGRPFLLNDFE